ncbi:MAG: hypothetical protein ACRBB0_03210 [Pelagimonas sp.]|uniref:hypothetical protein n=1 Tax=Pelagimonas sp. TaxID=2073170 RepID=UPI003D6BFEA7
MKGWLIFKHAFGMVLRNWQEAIKIGLLPVLLVIATGFIVLRSTAWELLSGVNPQDMENVFAQPQFFTGIVVVWLMAMLCMLWIVVNWHRFVLLEEFPVGWVPPLRFGHVLGYLGRIILLVLLAMCMMIPVGLVASFLMQALPALGIIAFVVAYLFLAILMYRVIAILPAGAVGKPIKIGQAFEATKGANGDIFVLLLVSFGANILLQLVIVALSAVSPILGGLVSIPISLALALVNVSVLTTFYGHYIEGRPLD